MYAGGYFFRTRCRKMGRIRDDAYVSSSSPDGSNSRTSDVCLRSPCGSTGGRSLPLPTASCFEMLIDYMYVENNYRQQLNFITLPPIGVVRLFVCPLAYVENHTTKFHEIFCKCYL